MEKLFIVGLPKTGLSTISAALSNANIKVHGSPRHIYGKDHLELERKFRGKAPSLIAQYDCFLDVPWCTEYRWLCERYPNSKFLLTCRDPSRWAKSYIRHFEGRSNALHFYQFQRNFISPSDFEGLKAQYSRFNREVEEFFHGHSGFYKLLAPNELTWEKLGEIIGKDIGSGGLPVCNSADKRNTLNWWFRNKPRAFVGQIIRKVVGSL